jgi:hypothetical protein
MKLEVDFSELSLAAAKMRGLDAYLTAIREANKTFDEGLSLAIQFVKDNGGKVETTESTTVLSLYFGTHEIAHFFQPYPDIDKFYFET